MADHCSVHALSDPSDKDLCQEGDQQHDERCSQCDALANMLVHIENIVQSSTTEGKDEAFYLCRTSVNAINSWKSHQLRPVYQDQARIDAINALGEHSALIVSDWAMKFIPQQYRESQQDWFGKRGMSWQIAVGFRQVDGILQS